MASPSEAQIARRAYEIWEKQGKPHGRHHEHWLQAVAELSGTKAPAAAPKAAATPKAVAARPAAPVVEKAPVAAVAASAKPKVAVTVPARTKTAPAKKK